MAVLVTLIQGEVWPHKFPPFKTQQEVPCFTVWLTRFLMLAPCGVLAYSLIGFSSKMCHQNCVNYSGQICHGRVCLGQAQMCSYHRAHYVHIVQSTAHDMLQAYSSTSHHMHLCKQIKGVMSKVNRQHNAKEYCRSEILYFSAEGRQPCDALH